MKQKLLLIISLFLVTIANSQEKGYCNRLSYSFDPLFAPFYHGVASGDALSDRVIIWTRVTSMAIVDSIEVKWFVATDTLFTDVVASGTLWTNENRDYTVKVDVTGLQPKTWYYYYFNAMETNSVIGRTKTIPVGATDSVRIAVVSGSNYNNGYFNAYQSMADRNDYDAVFHLGDYIYEYGTGEYGTHSDRELMPAYEITNLEDYRMRYSHYRLDPNLRFAHQQYPWYVIYDDHETANNSWSGGAENHTEGSEGNWNDRKAAGIRAFFEWIPIRDNPDSTIFRTFNYGDLAGFIFLDTRLEGRDDPDGLAVDDPSKTMLGTAQYNWFTNELLTAQHVNNIHWKFISQQVMFAPLKFLGITLNTDQWDGYEVERQKILNYVYGMGIQNTVVLTGDIHTSWAMDVPNPTLGEYGDNGQGCGFVEFVTPSVTSPSTDFGAGIGQSVIMSANEHIKWVDLANRGYFILDVNLNRCQADWYFINDINSQNYIETFADAWFVNYGETFLRHSLVPSMRVPPFQAFAPVFPDQTVEKAEYESEVVIMGLYPNPCTDKIMVQFYLRSIQEIKISIIDNLGKEIINQKFVNTCLDLNYCQINTGNISPG
ncbi:MAG: alkaline phosphatase D family protein, partial [Bacteroidales bacterium]|nr:alkaline phosphatase D family protein [Bacteroidales bacterium]